MPTKLADAPPGEIGDPGPDIADLELDRIATWSCYQEVRRTTEALCAPWRLKTTSSSRCPMPARPSGIWRTRRGSSRRSFWLPCSPASSQLIRSTLIFSIPITTPWASELRDRRGVLSRPTVAEVFRYRAAVDKRMKELLDRAGNTAFERVRSTLILGLHHEQQHQELILTDIKHALASNPRRPAYRERTDRDRGTCRARSAGLDSVCGQPEVDRP